MQKKSTFLFDKLFKEADKVVLSAENLVTSGSNFSIESTPGAKITPGVGY